MVQSNASVSTSDYTNMQNRFNRNDQYVRWIERRNDAYINYGTNGGPGLFVRSAVWERSNFGFSGNFGVGWIFKRNLEVFAEVSPKIGLVRETDFLVTGGLGFRYLF